MSAILLDGKIIRDKIVLELKEKVEASHSTPILAIIQVGNNAESSAFIEQKKLFAEKIGVTVNHICFDETVAQEIVLAQIQELNAHADVRGIIVQLPLPVQLRKDALIEAIDPLKDCDGLHSKNVKALISESGKGMIPATAKGVLTLCDYYNIDVQGKHVVVIGQSALVGKPVALCMLHRKATVTVCNKFTKDIAAHTKQADIIIIAAGAPKLITKEFVKEGQVVIDIGITVEHKEIDGKAVRKLVGDVDFENVQDIVAAITPVPGGVGPLTVASLFENLLQNI